MLKESGFNPGPVDGLWGENTEKALGRLLVRLGYLDKQDAGYSGITAALKTFQTDSGLPGTGRCGQETIEALARACQN